RRAGVPRHRRARDPLDSRDGDGSARRDHDRHRLIPVPEHRRTRARARRAAPRRRRRSAGDHVQHLPKQALRGDTPLGARLFAARRGAKWSACRDRGPRERPRRSRRSRARQRPSTPVAAGVLAVDKRGGWTSHDVVAVVRGVLGMRQVGHGGTLDPLASGLLPVLVGTATKFEPRMREATKVYDAVVRFGRETATDDREGESVREADVPPLDGSTIERGLATLRGVIEQTPPRYSALKIAGRPAYARARA